MRSPILLTAFAVAVLGFTAAPALARDRDDGKRQRYESRDRGHHRHHRDHHRDHHRNDDRRDRFERYRHRRDHHRDRYDHRRDRHDHHRDRLHRSHSDKGKDSHVSIHFGSTRHARVHRRWVPGHYVTRTQKVLVAPAYDDTRWVPPVYATRYDTCGTPYKVIVRRGYHDKVHVPARYQTRHTKVWVPGHYENVVVHGHSKPRVHIGAHIKF